MTTHSTGIPIPELLAPAGGREQLEAALRFGADAVYGGLTRFGLRAGAENFTPDTLASAIDETHRQGKRFYVTLNQLPDDSELDEMLASARVAARAGADAAIVSDLGMALLLHEALPELPMHISTQANVINSRSALHFHQAAGATRIVLARELSLADIRSMRDHLPPELALEAFVHGAMCISYSGRCLLSAVMTGRGANRGACAQPCRWRYRVEEEQRPGIWMPVEQEDSSTYLFSSYDLCMLPHLPELLASGVESFKIEGRMKSAYYVASVVSAYRRALDVLAEKGEAAYRAQVPHLMEELHKASHRAENTGFYFGAPAPAAGAAGMSQTMEYVGKVTRGAAAGEPVEIELKNRFYVGDTLEVLTPEGSFPFSVESIRLAETGEAVSTAGIAGLRLLLALPFPVSGGDLLRGPNRNHLHANAVKGSTKLS